MAYDADRMREKQMNIRLSAEESERLLTVASHYGLNAAAVLRMLVKREHDQIMQAAPKAEPTKRTRKSGARRG